MKNFRIFIWVGIVLIIGFVWLFIYKQKLFDTNAAINAERFAYFSTFISIFINLLTIGLLFYTYQQTQETHQITVKTFEKTKRDSFDSTFFNLIHNYRTIVGQLHNRITISLQSEFVRLNERKGSYFDAGKTNDKDFFELMYRILHLEYKQGEASRDISKVVAYFKNYNWIMGHYFMTVIYFIEWVYKNIEIDDEERKFYIGFIQSQLTSDEMRLLFYFVISRENTKKVKLSRIFKEYNFFSIIKPELIWTEGERDWREFEDSN